MSHLESDSAFRMRELHALFVSEFDRCAHDNAVRLLKQIAKESRRGKIFPDVPTTDVEVRLGFWRKLYDRAKAHRNYERSLQLLDCMRAEDAEQARA